MQEFLFFVGGLGKFGVSFQGMWAKSLAIDFFVGDISGKEQKQLLPRNLTWNLKMLVSKRKDFFSRDFFSGSMWKFQGCNKSLGFVFSGDSLICTMVNHHQTISDHGLGESVCLKKHLMQIQDLMVSLGHLFPWTKNWHWRFCLVSCLLVSNSDRLNSLRKNRGNLPGTPRP